MLVVLLRLVYFVGQAATPWVISVDIKIYEITLVLLSTLHFIVGQHIDEFQLSLCKIDEIVAMKDLGKTCQRLSS